MTDIYSGLVTHDSTASGTIFVRASNAEEASGLILDAARDGLGNFEQNEGNYVDEYYFGGGSNDVDFIGELAVISSQEDWDAKEPESLVLYPDDGDQFMQPYTKQQFMDFAYGKSEWAFQLYQRCEENERSPESIIGKGDVEEVLFQDANVQKLLRLLSATDVIKIEGGPTLTNWRVSEEDELLRLTWENNGMDYQFTESLHKVDVINGSFNGDAFICRNMHGDEIELKLFKLQSLLAPSIQAAPRNQI